MHAKRYHNIVDMTYCNSKIGNSKALREFIKILAEAIGMSILKGPITAQGVEKNPGLSVLAIIDYSHISIHTFLKYNEVLIDIFSCKEYDRQKVLSICKDYFKTKNTKIRQKEVWWGD